MPDRSVQAKDGEGRKMPDGLSALVARILEQLAVTAWLPAAMLIGVGSLLVQLHTNKSLDIPRAVQDLATKPWGVIIILLFGLVLTTMVTQAFSFASIRVLEGYWTPNRVVEPFLRRRVTRQVGLWKRLEARVQSLDQELFESARVRLLKEEDRNHVDVWEAQVYRIPKAQRRQQDKAVILAANTIDWRQKADPATAATFYRAQARLDDFPPGAPHRFLPMALGNVLRAYEERLRLPGATLERFVMTNYERIPARLMIQHDQFRDRLDMYCLLVLVYSLLACAAIPLLTPTGGGAGFAAPLGGCLLLIGLAWLSYRAAISSARGYGSTLLAIKDVIEESRR